MLESCSASPKECCGEDACEIKGDWVAGDDGWNVAKSEIWIPSSWAARGEDAPSIIPEGACFHVTTVVGYFCKLQYEVKGCSQSELCFEALTISLETMIAGLFFHRRWGNAEASTIRPMAFQLRLLEFRELDCVRAVILISFLLFFLPIGTNRASNNGGLERLSFGKAILAARAVRKEASASHRNLILGHAHPDEAND